MSTLLKEFDPLSEGRSNSQVNEVETSKDQSNEELSNEKSNTTKKNDALESEEEPFFDFQLFIKNLKDPKAEPLVKYTKSFLSNFATQRDLWSATEQEKLIYDFKLFIFDKFSLFDPFKEFDAVNLNNAQEGMEKLMMGKLYSRCYSPELVKHIDINLLDDEHKNDIIEDKVLEDKIKEYNFIELNNLDITNKISSKLDNFVKLASKELNKVNNFKAPRDKMVCILNACKVIFGILKHFQLDKNGADSFIPLLIYVIINGGTSHLMSNIRYIERFRFNKFLKSEDQYYLSSLQGAANFIISLSEDMLTIGDKESFEQKYSDNLANMKEEREELEAKPKAESGSIKANFEHTSSPIDDITTSMVSMFNDFFIRQPLSTEPVNHKIPLNKDSKTIGTETDTDSSKDDKQMSKIIKKIENKERAETLATLCSMFPDLSRELIEDICMAKKYRTGVCVDTLLSLYD